MHFLSSSMMGRADTPRAWNKFNTSISLADGSI